MDAILDLLHNRTVPAFKFQPDSEETSNVTDEEFVEMVKKGKHHCFIGDVFRNNFI